MSNGRFAEVSGYLHSLHSYVIEPGAAGPVAMSRLVALEEGIQECEARICIEDALVNQGLAKRSPELAKRCQEGVTAWRFQAGVSGHAWLLGTAQRERTKKLYELADEVERELAR